MTHHSGSQFSPRCSVCHQPKKAGKRERERERERERNKNETTHRLTESTQTTRPTLKLDLSAISCLIIPRHVSHKDLLAQAL